MGAAFSAAPTTAASAASESAGFGHSSSQILQLDPRTAGLSYQVTFGAAIADHLNAVARSQAQMVNFGVIGTAMSTPACQGADPYVRPEQLPKPVRVDSRDDGAEDGKTVENGPFTESARANQRPFAESSSRIAPLDFGGVVTFMGGSALTNSGVDTSGKSQATAEVNVAGLSFAGGLVKLEGLHWRSASRLDKPDPKSLFSIDSITIAGQKTNGGDEAEMVEAANLVLAPFGLFLGMPKVHAQNDTIFVDPLRVGIVPSELRDSIPARVLRGLQPIREAVFGYLLENAPCQYSPASLILVADILTLSVTGGGSFNVNVGGTQAQTKRVTQADAYGALPLPVTPPTPSVVDDARVSAPAGDTALEGLTDVTGNDGRGSGDASRRALGRLATDGGDDDNALWVALAVIGLGFALVEGEVRVRRRAAAGSTS